VTEIRYSLWGEIDLENAHDVRDDLRTFMRASTTDLVLDCSELTFIDTFGITVLLGIHWDLEAEGRRLLIASVAPSVARAFEILHLGDLLFYDHNDPQGSHA
jgi:anti-sigma B factor antagonist